jgi:EmrB/QacA subfamily drug resistance transporter
VTGRRLLLAALIVCTFLTALDIFVVGTAMPTIVAQLGGMSLYTWVFSSYLLASTVSVPVYGKLADTYGRKPIFTFGTAVFLLGSVLCGFAQDMTQLILFRVVQGLGAGAVFPVTLTIVGDQFSLEERARTIGLFSATWGVAGIVGPLVGGFITDYWHWRWIFFLNLPVGAAALAMLWWTLRERVERRQHRIDYAGALVLTIGLTALMIGLLEAGETLPRLSARAIGLFLIAGLLFAFCGWYERRVAEPILPLDLLRQRLILVAGLCVFLTGVANAGVGTFVPVLAQGVLGGTATMAGATLVPIAFTWTLGSVVGGRLMLRLGYRLVAILGTVVIALGSAGLATLSEGGSFPAVLLAVGVVGLGMGLSVANFTISVQNAVPWEQRGAVTSSNQFFRSIGQAVGVAALGAVFNLRMGVQLDAAGQDLAIANAVLDPLVRRTLDPGVLASTRGILGDSLQTVFLILLLTAVANVLMAAQLPGGSPADHAWKPRAASSE